MEQVKYWPYKPQLSCSDVDVIQTAAEQHYVKCAVRFFKQVWGSDIDFQVEALPAGGFKARVMIGQLVWCSCIHPNNAVAVNAAAKAAVEIAMQKASRGSSGRAQGEPGQRLCSPLLQPAGASAPSSRGATNNIRAMAALQGLMSPESPADTDSHCDQSQASPIRLTPDQAKLQQNLLMELLGSMTHLPCLPSLLPQSQDSSKPGYLPAAPQQQRPSLHLAAKR